MAKNDFHKLEHFLNEVYLDLRVLRDAIRMSRNKFLANLKYRFAVRYALVDVVGTSTLIGLRILEEKFGVRPETYCEVFDLLADLEVISFDVCNGMNSLIDLRNTIVNIGFEVDDLKIYNEIKRDGLNIIEKFICEVEDYVKGS